ncbi:MAG: glycosyltransferase, partial [Patescibacteria group bacterium]
MLDLSIVIVNFNTKKLVEDCFDSIKKEESKISWEVIVVDNGSIDGSKDAFRKLEKEYNNFKLILNNENLGYAKANNQGVKISKGKYLLLLNSDTIVKRYALGNLIKFAEKTSDAGVIGSRLYNLDGSLQPSCFHFPTIKNALLEYFFNKKGLFDK